MVYHPYRNVLDNYSIYETSMVMEIHVSKYVLMDEGWSAKNTWHNILDITVVYHS